MYDSLANLFNTINSLDYNVKFREIFRVVGIELSKFINISEMYFLVYTNQYSGIYYKKERAYDKQVDFDSLDDTINFLAINYEQEMTRIQQDIKKLIKEEKDFNDIIVIVRK